jgi:hypothetical protein
MLRSLIIFFILFSPLHIYAQEENKITANGLGISTATNYTFSGIGVILNLEWQNYDHIFYTGPKIPLSKTYLPFRSPFGWNIGYRHEYNKSQQKKMSFFFNIDYQLEMSKSFSAIQESKKINSIHEAFIGYGVQYKFCDRLYLANVLGVGGYYESYYNPDLNLRKNYGGYNNMFKFFVNYKF